MAEIQDEVGQPDTDIGAAASQTPKIDKKQRSDFIRNAAVVTVALIILLLVFVLLPSNEQSDEEFIETLESARLHDFDMTALVV